MSAMSYEVVDDGGFEIAECSSLVMAERFARQHAADYPNECPVTIYEIVRRRVEVVWS